MTAIFNFGFRFCDLYSVDGVTRLDRHFMDYLSTQDAGLNARLAAARAAPDRLGSKDHAELIIGLAPLLEKFIGQLFRIEAELKGMQSRDQAMAPLHTVKRLFVQRRAAKKYGAAQAETFSGNALRRQLENFFSENLTEQKFATVVLGWMEKEQDNSEALDIAARYAAWAVHTAEGQHLHRDGVVFKIPHKIDPQNLVPHATEVVDTVPVIAALPDRHRQRDGFTLTDPGMKIEGALDHANYCIWCHEQGKDSCAKGLVEKTGEFKKSMSGVTLAGCPLDEKISEMNRVRALGYSIGALAIATIDNPMCAATGHRICNDCMKACIYQKQEPVDIPQIETRTLKDVLSLPWGFEIYSLLTRWSPLNLRRPVPKAPTGRKILVVGQGPAGFTLAHHLLNEGHSVVAIDGLKIEPLPAELSGVAPDGKRHAFAPIRDVDDLREGLSDRVTAGFGGVAEYGITVRWDKNFLKMIRLLLERRESFRMFGGVRFGGALTIDSAFDLGFDHIALCTGAGRPSVVPMKNGLANGVRQASDFLMALQLTGAAKADSIANLQVRLPIVVIGGGLTAVDTATEALAYYPVQVEKFLNRHETLVAEHGENAVAADWTPQEREIAAEFLRHARAIRAERAAAAREGRPPQLIALLQGWGGATLVYRRRLVDAPSYTLNHEEVAKALEEGIRFAERLTPEEVLLDDYGCAHSLRVSQAAGSDAGTPQREFTLPARTILVAAGTQPNTVLARENPQTLSLDGKFYQAYDESGQPVAPERMTKPKVTQVLMHIRHDGRAISFFGDLHPSYAGNVVKAMASAKQGYPVVTRMLERLPAATTAPAQLFALLDNDLRATVHAVVKLTANIVEVVVRAPMAARAFKPGQFYRLQNYEMLARRADGTRLAMEGIALTGAKVDHEKGLISLIVLEMGGSSDLCAQLQPGEPVVLMGPTGQPTQIPLGETVLLIGGGLGNAVLFSIGQAMRARGNRVIYFAGYKNIGDRYKEDEIEQAADAIVWCCDEAPGFRPTRPQDMAFVGNIIEGIDAYATGKLGDRPIALGDVDRIIAIGSDGMMAAVAKARWGILARHLKTDHKAIASINSPMQCMMKEICAQCLQLHRDPATGIETVVFSCFDQDQNLDAVDFGNLRARLGQNSLQEKQTKLWIGRALRRLGLRHPIGSKRETAEVSQ